MGKCVQCGDKLLYHYMFCEILFFILYMKSLRRRMRSKCTRSRKYRGRTLNSRTLNSRKLTRKLNSRKLKGG